MPLIASLKTWINNEILTATDLNANYAELRTTTNAWAAWRDQAQTFTAAQTFGALTTHQAGASVAGGVTVTSGGVAVTGASSVAGGLTVSSGGVAVTGNSTITGTLNVSAGIAGNGSGLTGITVSAANVTPGNFPTGNYDIDGTLNANAVTVDNGQMRGRRITQTGAGGTVSFATANHVRHTMTGNGTLTLAGGVAGGVYTVEVLQDGTGGRTVTWSGATWEAGIAPTSTTTANRKDVFTFFFDGSAYLGVVFGLNFASTA